MKKLNSEFVDALTNFVYEQTGNLPKYRNIIQSCINDLEARANHEDNCVVITLMQDPENPKLFTLAYAHEINLGGELYRIVAFADKNYIEV